MRKTPCEDGCLPLTKITASRNETPISLGNLVPSTSSPNGEDSRRTHLRPDAHHRHHDHKDAGSRSHSHFRWDRWGIGISGLCIIHCLALPLLLIMNPFMTFLPNWHREFHLLIFFLASYFAVLSFSQGYSHHRKKIIPLLGLIGCGFILGNVIFEFYPVSHQHATHLTVTLSSIGGCFLILAHYLNIRACRE